MRTQDEVDLTECWRAGVAAVEPAALVSAYFDPGPRGPRIVRGEVTVARLDGRHLFLVAAGKAADAMARAALGWVGVRMAGGVVVAPRPPGERFPRIRYYVAGHPVPDAGSAAAGRAVWRMLGQTGSDDMVLLLLSGGASSLLACPAEGIRLADKTATTRLLLASGAPISSVNAVRKHLSRLKGGGLARRALPARTIGLLLSDVIGNDSSVIGSGPSAADPTTFEEARRVLDAHGVFERVPARVRRRILDGCAGRIPDTPSPGELRARNFVIGDIRVALAAAAAEAKRRGRAPHLAAHSLRGDVRAAAGRLVTLALAMQKRIRRPACLLGGGETTVRVMGSGRGGRNQEMALRMARDLRGHRGITVLCAGTDGVDGSTSAAGAFADGEVWDRALWAGIDPDRYLARNDSGGFFAQTGGTFCPGPTGTNVMDLSLILVQPR